MLADIADEFDVAIDLVSHARKGTATPGDADRDRGASAKRDAGRLMRTATAMTTEEAQALAVGAAERTTLIRIDDAKVNLTPRSSQAMWFQLVSVPLGNTNVDPLYSNGDNVQTVKRWYPPDVFAGLSIPRINEILDKIDAGPYPGGQYSPAGNAKDRAAWPLVQQFLPDGTVDQAKLIISTWLKNGVLVKQPHEDPKDRHQHPASSLENDPATHGIRRKSAAVSDLSDCRKLPQNLRR